ncbi:MAG TPA: SAM-dependent methyltransferase [Pyrinomonadaceae bacterium]|nr:SAM-dependent methyltransferase [Pyrinomonadaceae bacterium]
MKTNRSSATAYLIAESAVYLSGDKTIKPLIEPEIVELSGHFAGSRAFSEKLVYTAKRQSFFRPVFSALENLTIPGLQLHYLLRKRRLEEIARRATAEDFRQIVIFGAGFDTLALRLHKNFPGVDFIEIDYPATQAAKRKTVEQRNLAATNLKFISLDLTEKFFSESISGSRYFRRDAKTLFIAEGLLMYFKPEEVKNLFDFVNQNGLENSRFAFTFMERRKSDGRIAFRNSSKLVDFWLKLHGEPFLWGMPPDELENFLDERDFILESLDSEETFRRKYLASAEMKRLPLAAGEWLCVAATRATPKIFVNDIHSKLNRTSVAEIIKPGCVEEIQRAIKKAGAENKFVSIAGGFHAMGGQQFLSGGVLLDMSEMNRVLKFEPEKQSIEVESGIHWKELIDFTISAQSGEKNRVGIRQKQTGADNLSVGGALSANIHGRGLQMKPFIDDVKSFRLINADGEISNCSRDENAELFRLAIGGYGLFGIIANVKLRLSKRRKLRRRVEIENSENLDSLFKRRISEDFSYGDFQFAVNPDSDDFLRKGVFSCYLPVPDETPVSETMRELSPDNWKNLLYLAHTEKQKAFELYASHYRQTDGQIYWSDTHQLSTYLNDYHRQLDERLNAKCPGSEMITEIYVPLEKLPDFMNLAREDFRRDKTDLIYGTIRLIRRDTESFLAWARADFACVVFNLHVEHDDAGIEKAEAEFKQLIDRAINFGGSFYLTYHRWATKRQISACYPQMPEFLRLKKKFDAAEMFQSDWYRHCKYLFD